MENCEKCERMLAKIKELENLFKTDCRNWVIVKRAPGNQIPVNKDGETNLALLFRKLREKLEAL